MAANVKIPDDAYSRNALWESLSSVNLVSSISPAVQRKMVVKSQPKIELPDNFQQVLIFPVRLKTREKVDSTLISLAITDFIGWNLT